MSSAKKEVARVANWRANEPFNGLPLLPPKSNLETHALLKQCILARAALA